MIFVGLQLAESPPAVIRLTVHRWLQVIRTAVQLVGIRFPHRPFSNFGVFFQKILKFQVQTFILQILYVSSISMSTHMQEDLLLYRLLDRVLHARRLTPRSQKMMKILKFFEMFSIYSESF